MKIVVLAGGLSDERNVSLSSGTLITEALRRKGHRVALVDLYMGLEGYDGTSEALFDAPVPEEWKKVSRQAPDLKKIKAARQWQSESYFGVGVLELAGKSLTFEEPDESRFPCLRLAYEAMKAGGGMPCVMNAADESAVSAFLRGETDFYGIADVVERTLEHFSGAPAESVEQLIELGSEAKAYAAALIAR